MRRGALILGGAMLAAVLVATVLLPAAALRAWLGATFLWSGVPIGSLGLLMMIRVIGGRWGYGLAPVLEAGALALPVAALAMVPVLVAMRSLYPWAVHPVAGFKGAWLAPLPFAARTLLLFAGLVIITAALVRRRGSAKRWSAAGLLFLAPMASLVAVDWVVSLDRNFHSSGFGLYALSIQHSMALSVAAWVLLGRQPRRTATLAPLMATLLLIALYLSFTSYFIVWSGDLAPLVGWYGARGGGGWGAAYAVVVGIEIVALLALLAPSVRGSARALRGIAAATIIAKAIEAAWLVLPQGGAVAPVPVLLYALAAIGLGLVTIAAQQALLDRRIARRMRHGR